MKHIFCTACERSNRREILAVTTQLKQLGKDWMSHMYVCLTVIYRYPVEKKVSKYAIFFGCVWERADVLKNYFRNIVLGVKSLLYVNQRNNSVFFPKTRHIKKMNRRTVQ